MGLILVCSDGSERGKQNCSESCFTLLKVLWL